MQKIIVKKNNFLEEFFTGNFKIIGIIVFVLIILLGYFFLLNPKIKDIKKKKLELDAKNVELSSLEKEYKSFEELKNSYSSLNNEHINNFEKMLPSKDVKSELLIDLEGMVIRSGMILNSINIIEEGINEKKRSVKNQESKESNKIGKYKIDLDILGAEYSNLKFLINLIENNLRILDISKISFSPESKKVNLEIFSYYYK